MKEHEYSFEVKDLTPYINFCEENGYKLISKNKQSRTIYRNPNKTMARITLDETEGKIVKSLDFKEDKLSSEVLIERKESMALYYDDDKAIESILDFLDYKKDNTLIRTRIVYLKEDVKFEFDIYEEPRQTCVVALEGDSKKTDEVYCLVSKLKHD